ncbi:MAG TPA: hypothetical protein VLA54_11150 [Acidimicrobiia bacterium]|jgi:hypothetical protein|nr:hypothetical protein [Acidimicrobiia bacterium]
MDSTTDLDQIERKLEVLRTVDPAEAADLAAEIAGLLATALDALDERPEI